MTDQTQPVKTDTQSPAPTEAAGEGAVQSAARPDDLQLGELMEPNRLVELLHHIGQWLQDHVLTIDFVWQAAAISFAYLVAAYLARMIRPKVETLSSSMRYARFIRYETGAIIWLCMMWLMVALAVQFEQEFQAMNIVASLLSAWVVIRFLSQAIRDPIWARFTSLCIWSIAALSIVGVLDDTISVLDKIAFTMGEIRVSALGVIKGALSLTIMLWIARALSRMLERRIARFPNMTPSARVLIGKLFRLVLIIIAVAVGISSIGVDLTAFAVFGGALGVGIGFGLQKVISNFVSGLILLLERSVKPGDVIALGQTYGWIQSLGARYVSVITRDGIEHLIPNEEFITQRVENWSYTNKLIRLRLPLGIAYSADLDLAMQLCIEAAFESDQRVKPDPEPRCLITGFGDNSINLELRIWIDDPQEGRGNIMSDVYYLIWKKFNENGIEIPFPQRDIHIRSGGQLATG